MKTTLLKIAIASALSLGASTASAVIMTFTVNLQADNLAFPSAQSGAGGDHTAPFGDASAVDDDLLNDFLNPDFRVVSSFGFVSGGGEKRIAPGVSWTFDDVSNELVSVAGTDMTPGCTGTLCTTNGGNASAAPGGDTGLFANAPFTEVPFGFLAPTAGSAAATTFGVGTISGDTDGNGDFTISFPVLESQWNGGIFQIGRTADDGSPGPGNTLNCTSVATVFNCQGETVISPFDDTLGFAGQTIQFDLTGTIVPIPAAVWLFGSGLLGLVGVARRKKLT